MNTKHPFKSILFTPSSQRRFICICLNFITVSFLVFSILCCASSGVALAQGPPEWAACEGCPTVTVTGLLTIIHGDDFENQRGKFFYSLKDLNTNEIFNLHFAQKPGFKARSGAIITVRGKAKGRDLYLALDESGTEGVDIALPAVEAVTGEQRTIVMVVNFLDASVSCSINDIRDLMFTDSGDMSIDDYYLETSVGNVRFAGDVVGPYVIKYESTSSCAPFAWADAADAEAKADGINLSNYDRKVYVLPQENPCGFSGLGSIGGSPSQAWIFLCDIIDVYGHELGHNLGMNHSAIPEYEYGDVSDIMGLSGYGLRRVNAPHMEQMGWLPPDQVFTVIASGTYDISPLEANPWEAIAPQVLKIIKPDTAEYYYLSYRRPLDFDAGLSPYYLDGINVHRYIGDGSPNRTYLLDVLSDGESFIDVNNGLNVTQIIHSNDYIRVQVEFDTTCTPQAPMVSLSPESLTSESGTTFEYIVSVTNTDSQTCTQSTFSLSPSLPYGWTGTISQGTLTLSPGETGLAILSVTSPEDAADGSYELKLDVSDATEPIHTSSDSSIYMVQVNTQDDTEPPTPPTGLSATLKGKNIKLSWNASTDNVGVSGYALWRNGTCISNVTGTSYIDGSVSSGATYTYWVEAYDEAGNNSAPSNQVNLTVKAKK